MEFGFDLAGGHVHRKERKRNRQKTGKGRYTGSKTTIPFPTLQSSSKRPSAKSLAGTQLAKENVLQKSNPNIGKPKYEAGGEGLFNSRRFDWPLFSGSWEEDSILVEFP